MKIKEILSPTAKDFEQPETPMITVSVDSDFCQEIVAKGWLTAEQMAHAAARYRLGRSRSGRCIFWMIDQQGIVRDGHIGNSWASDMLRSREPELLKDWRTEHCLFGLHLTSDIRHDLRSSLLSLGKLRASFRLLSLKRSLQTLDIALVERESSAVILSELFPERLWLASCNLVNLTVENLAALHGHRVTLFPPTDPTMSTYVSWLEIADQAHRQLGLDISVSSILEDHATPAQKEARIDLVDFLDYENCEKAF